MGRYIRDKFKSEGYDVDIVSRDSGDVRWDDEQGLTHALEGSELVLNLAGRSVDCRYNEKNKLEILRSRTETTKAIGNAVLKCSQPPKLWINSSTATIYRHAEDRPMTEAEGDLGTGFSVDVATRWEQSFFGFTLSQTRQVALRMAIVVGKDGGVMEPLKRLTLFGLGGKQGSGKQMFSWVHIEDIYRIIVFLMEHQELSGVFNCSSPNPVSNSELMDTLRKAMGMRIGLPSPAWLLEIGAVVIRTETELILKSRWVLPERLMNAGFRFKYEKLGEAVMNIEQGTRKIE